VGTCLTAEVVVEFTGEEHKLLPGMRAVVNQWAKMGDAVGWQV